MLNRKISIGLVIIMTTSIISSCSSGGNKAVAKIESPITVTVASPDGGTSSGMIEASGKVEAIHSINISTRAMGYITKMPIKVGDNVKEGQLLFTVNSADINAKKAQIDAMIAQADAALQSARKDFERYSVLYKQQSATAKELDQVTLQFQSAKANADAAREMRNEVSANLAYTNVKAPFAGVVTQKFADAGSMATPGMPVLTIEQSGNLQVAAAVSENQIAALKIGDLAMLTIGSDENKLNGKVIEINPSSQFSGGQYIVKISLPEMNKQLYSGMFVHVQFASKVIHVKQQTESVMIPLNAVVQKDQLTGIYTISAQNTALLRWLRLGKVNGNQVEVLSGLAKNEQYILSADSRLYNGAPIKIK